MDNRIRFSISSGLMGMSLAAPLTLEKSATTTPRTTVEMNGQSQTDAMVYKLPVNAQAHANAVVFNFSDQSPQWQKSDERRFLELARKEALGTASVEEIKMLEAESKRRDRLKCRLSIDEILFRKRQKEIELKLLSTLQEYFSFGRSHARKNHQIKG